MSNIVPHDGSGYLVPRSFPNNPPILNPPAAIVRGVAEFCLNLVEQVDTVKTKHEINRYSQDRFKKEQREIDQTFYEGNLLNQDEMVARMLSDKVAFADFQCDRGLLTPESADFIRHQASAILKRRQKRGYEL